MIIIPRLGRWNHCASQRFTWTRIWWKGYRWTPFCHVRLRITRMIRAPWTLGRAWWQFSHRHIRCWWRLRFVLTGNCGHHCTMVQPYGFVPEAGCPVHDISCDDNCR